MVDARAAAADDGPPLGAGRWLRHARRLLRAPFAVLVLREGRAGCRLAAGAGDLPEGLAAEAEALGRRVLEAGVGAATPRGLGAPLRREADAAALGALCVLDPRPRNWGADDAELLADLAAVASVGAGEARPREALAPPGARDHDAGRAPLDAGLGPLAGEERLRLALDAAGMGAWDWDLGTDEAAVDARGRDLLGFAPEGPATGAELAARTHPEDAARMRAVVAAVMADPRGEYAAEFRLVRGDGAVRWVASRGRAVRDGEGARPSRLVGVSYDATDLKAAQAGPERERQRLRQLLDGLSEGVTAVFVDEGVTVRNRAWLEFHGFASFDELPPGGRFEDVYALFDLRDEGGAPVPVERAPLGRALKGETFGGLEVRLRRRDTGREWWGSFSGAAVRDAAGAVTLAVVTMRDVTGRKHLDEELRRGEARLGLALANAPVVLFEQDLALRFTWIQRPALGFDAADIVGRTDAELLGEAQAAPLEAVKRRALESGAPQGAEISVAANGETRHYDLYVEPRRDEAGAVAGLRAAAVDITARKEAEAERELLLGELDHRIRNLFSVAGAIVALCARQAAGPQELARAAQQRFAALARAHTVLRGHGRADSGADLAELAATVLGPHGDPASGRVSLEGPPFRVGARATVMVSLVLHELATNAAKYGALSDGAGRLRLAWSLAAAPGRLALVWEERGGPSPAGPPAREGFGSLLVRESVRVGLGGTVDLAYEPAGLTVRIEAALARLEAG